METILLYLGKVIVCSGVMFLYYQLSLKDKTFHHYNRFYLLSAMLISLLLPLIKVEDFTIAVSNEMYLLLDKIQNFNTTKTINNDHIYFRIIFSALGLVSFYFLARFLYGIFKIQKLKNQFQKESFDGINFYHTNLTEAPFSYFKNLFWKNTITLNSDIGKQILKHEMVHIEQKHSFDKIFIEVITAIFWFNPFFHIIKKEISLIHEYLADKKAVKKSDTKAFAQMLLASHFSGTQLPATSPFLSSNLKKRLKMLQKPQTKFGYARRIFALPVLFTIAFAYMVNAKNKEIKETNIAIEETVSQIEKDTVRPDRSQRNIVVPKIYKKSGEEKKIAELGEKIQEKSKALKELNPESKEFQKNIDEISSLSEEISKITNSEDFMKSAMTMKFDGKEMAINDSFKSEEWKNKVKELKKMEVEIPDMSEFNFDFPDVPVPSAAPNAPNAPKVKVYKFNDRKDISNLSKKEMRKLEKLAKEKAELSKKQAEIVRKKAEITREQVKMQGNPWIIGVDAHAKPGVKYIVRNNYADGSKINPKLGINKTYLSGKDASLDNIKIIIDGKEATKEEMNALDSEKIRDIHVRKNNVDGKMEGEISINTKK